VSDPGALREETALRALILPFRLGADHAATLALRGRVKSYQAIAPDIDSRFPEFKGRNLAFRVCVSFNALYENSETRWQTTTGGYCHSVRSHLGDCSGDVAIRVSTARLSTYS